MTIVEGIVKPNVDKQWLLQNLIYINKTHFEEAVLERAISGCCGYPLCTSELSPLPNKRYKMSMTEYNTYDLTDIEYYCSNMCYKAGTFLKDQLYTSPLWLRDCEISVDYKLLTIESQGTGAGAEIDLGNINPVTLEKAKNEFVGQKEQDISDNKCKNNLKIDTENFSLLDSSTNDPHLSDLPKDDATSGVADIDIDSSALESLTYKVEFVITDLRETNNKYYEECAASDKEPFYLNKPHDNQILKSDSSDKSNHGEEPLINLQDKSNLEVEAIINDHAFKNMGEDNFNSTLNISQHEHNSNESLLHDSVLHENIFNEISNDNSRDFTSEIKCSVKGNPNTSKETTFYKYWSELNIKFQETIFEISQTIIAFERKVESWLTLESMVYLLGQERLRELLYLKISGLEEDSSLPKSSKEEDYLTIQKCQAIYEKIEVLELAQNEDIILSISDFLLNEPDERISTELYDIYNEETEGNNMSNISVNDLPLPPLTPIQSRTFITRLNIVLPDLLTALNLSNLDLDNDLKDLIDTFHLNDTSIALTTSEWQLVAVILIKLLSIKNDKLHLDTHNYVLQEHLMKIHKINVLDEDYIERFTSYLMNFDRLIDSIHVE